MNKQVQLKLIDSAGLVGSLVFGIFSLLHPLTFDPWNTYGTFEKVSHHKFWVVDHIFIIIGISLWLASLVAGQAIIENNGVLKKVGSGLMNISLSVWVVILTFEIGVIPLLVNTIEQNQTDTLMTIWFVVFGFGLLGGYFAFSFTWIGVFLYSLAMSNHDFPQWFKVAGVWSGLAGAIGIITGLLMIDFVVPILIFTSGPPFIWTILLFIYMVKVEKFKESV